MKAPIARLRAWARRQRRDRMTAEARKECCTKPVGLSAATRAKLLAVGIATTTMRDVP